MCAYGCWPTPVAEELFGWVGKCPHCRVGRLKLTIVGEGWESDQEMYEEMPVVIGCSLKCLPPDQLRKLLARQPGAIAHDREIEGLKAQIRFWVEFAQRQSELDGTWSQHLADALAASEEARDPDGWSRHPDEWALS